MLPAHKSGHTLDLVLADEFLNVIENVTVEPVSTISNHKIVSFIVK